MKHLIKRGTSIPTEADLEDYQLGWCTGNKKLYIKDNGVIRQLSSTVILEDNTFVESKQQAIQNNGTYIFSAISDDLLFTVTFNFSNNILNFKINPTGDRKFTLQNALAHREWMTAEGYRSLSDFNTLETDSINTNLCIFDNAIDKNFYCEMFFTINGYDYKIDFRSAEENSTSVSAICTMSKTVA